jgi:hypothetical protein
VARQERIDLGSGEDEWFLSGAQTGLPEKELGYDALNPAASLGVGADGAGLIRLWPGQGHHGDAYRPKTQCQDDQGKGPYPTAGHAPTIRRPPARGKLDKTDIMLYMK